MTYVRIDPSEKEVEWVKDHQHWTYSLHLQLKGLSVVFECKVEAEVVEKEERDVIREVKVRSFDTKAPFRRGLDLDLSLPYQPRKAG